MYKLPCPVEFTLIFLLGLIGPLPVIVCAKKKNSHDSSQLVSNFNFNIFITSEPLFKLYKKYKPSLFRESSKFHSFL